MTPHKGKIPELQAGNQRGSGHGLFLCIFRRRVSVLGHLGTLIDAVTRHSILCRVNSFRYVPRRSAVRYVSIWVVLLALVSACFSLPGCGWREPIPIKERAKFPLPWGLYIGGKAKPRARIWNPAFFDTVNRLICLAGGYPVDYKTVLSADSAASLLGHWERGEIDTVFVSDAVVLGGLSWGPSYPGSKFWTDMFKRQSEDSWRNLPGPDRTTPGRAAIFVNNIFLGEVGFTAARFNGRVSFERCVFPNRADFLGAVFCDGVDFSMAEFSEVDFSYAIFWKGVNFSYCVFTNPVLFEWARFDGSVDFLCCHFMKWALFRGGLFYGEVNVDWRQLHGRVSCDPQAYVAFIRVFRQNGDSDSERACDYDFWCYKTAEIPPDISLYRPLFMILGPLRHPELFCAWATCGFGYKPLRTVIAAALLMFSFALVLWDRNAVKPTQAGAKVERDHNTSFRDALYFSISTFLRFRGEEWHVSDQPLMVSPSRAARSIRESRLWVRELGPLVESRATTFVSWVVCKVARKLRISARDLALLEGILGWLVLALFIATLTKLWL